MNKGRNILSKIKFQHSPLSRTLRFFLFCGQNPKYVLLSPAETQQHFHVYPTFSFIIGLANFYVSFCFHKICGHTVQARPCGIFFLGERFRKITRREELKSSRKRVPSKAAFNDWKKMYNGPRFSSSEFLT